MKTFFCLGDIYTMSADSVVYDMSQMGGENTPSIFVRKDNLEIMDMMNGNYAGNQLIFDTSTLSNSNKFVDYRNARLSIPLMYTLSCTDNKNINGMQGAGAMMGMKQTFQHLVHSIQLEWAGTSILQSTPYSSFWSAFQLETTFSMSDVVTNGKTIGFYPNSSNFAQFKGSSVIGSGTCNNVAISSTVSQYQLAGNEGALMRSMAQNAFAPTANTGQIASSLTYAEMTNQADFGSLRQSSLYQEVQNQVYYAAIQSTIRLRDLCDFFSNLPLLKGVFFRLTLNLNQCTVNIEKADGKFLLTQSNVISPLGGAVPFMMCIVPPGIPMVGEYEMPDTVDLETGAITTKDARITTDSNNPDGTTDDSDELTATNCTFTMSLGLGNKPLSNSGLSSYNIVSKLNQSCFMYVNAYTFNPIFEQAYLSKPAKTIVYEDIFQFTTAVAPSSNSFNFLVTNGLSNLKGVLVMPVFDYPSSSDSTEKTLAAPFQSVFDTCPDTPSPMVQFTNFNVTVAGANMIYNNIQYPFEMYENHLAGINSINANLSNGLTSGLIDFWQFQRNKNFYWVDTSRQLPIDQAIPKSVAVSGYNTSSRAVKLYVFCVYGVEISVDILTGARI